MKMNFTEVTRIDAKESQGLGIILIMNLDLSVYSRLQSEVLTRVSRGMSST